MIFNLLSNVYLIDKLEPYATWITVGIFCCAVVACIILLLTDNTQNKQKSINIIKKIGIGLIFYALALGICLLSFEISKKFDQAYLTDNVGNTDVIKLVFIPILSTLVVALIFAIILYIVSKKAPTKAKLVTIIGGALIFVGITLCIILTYIYFSNNILGGTEWEKDYYINYGKLNQIALWIFSALVVVAIILAGVLLGRKDKKPFDTKCIAMAGVCVAISFALSYIKFLKMPYGGSVTLVSMLPIMLFAYVYGTKKGLLVCLLYGILQAVQDPFIIHPAQFLLDYPIAYTMVGFAGIFTSTNSLANKPRLKFTLSAIIAGALRYLCHVLSGVFAFGAYALDATGKLEGIFAFITPFENIMSNIVVYSFAYNFYILIDVVLVILASFVLLSSKAFTKELSKLY